jgi:phosphoglycerate dehydrogenase-like enzyme
MRCQSVCPENRAVKDWVEQRAEFSEEETALLIQCVPLEQLLKESDFVTLHIPLTDSTRGLIGAKELALMKPTARIINDAAAG